MRGRHFVIDSAEVYDPATGRFALAGTFPALDLSGPVDAGVAVGGFETYKAGLLIPLSEDGAVLIDHAGYSKHVGTVSRWLRFDADSGAWRDISAPHFTLEDPLSGATYQSPGTTRYEPAVARVADGRVLTAGGTFGDSLASAEVYDPTSDTWTSLPDMPEPRSQGQAVTLGDGSVLVVGGYYFQVDMPISLRSAVRLVFGD